MVARSIRDPARGRAARARFSSLAALAVLALALRCVPAFAASDAMRVAGAGSILGALPVTYAGLLPCGDCVGVRIQLNLLPGGAYMRRTTHLREGRDESHYDVDAWSLSGDGTLTLHGGSEGDARWAVRNARTLRAQPAGLENSRWRPVRIGDRSVTVSGRQREPWIVLEPGTRRVTGSGGCNRISGSYEAGTGTLRFSPMISTQMACPSMETETAFLRALNGTRRFRVQGRILELMDDGGRTLVRLEERNLE